MFSLESEVRNDHLVTEETKKLWFVQMELLKELQRICKKYNIKYYAIEGTLLGAVRHNGYIPWDDDIDVGMHTKDYDKFCKVVSKELPSYYEFQHFSTQDGIGVGISRIRDKRTTGCTKYEYSLLARDEAYNCGIFIDIFPMSNVAPNKIMKRIQTQLFEIPRLALSGYLEELRIKNNESNINKKALKYWRFLSKLFSYKTIASLRYQLLKIYPYSKKMGLIGFSGYKDIIIWDKKWFEETVELPFEDITISCPKGYHEFLTYRYGDYNVFIKGASLHSFEIIDTEISYKEKLKKHYAEMQSKL